MAPMVARSAKRKLFPPYTLSGNRRMGIPNALATCHFRYVSALLCILAGRSIPELNGRQSQIVRQGPGNLIIDRGVKEIIPPPYTSFGRLPVSPVNQRMHL
jgi:hypothetical protein